MLFYGHAVPLNYLVWLKYKMQTNKMCSGILSKTWLPVCFVALIVLSLEITVTLRGPIFPFMTQM